MKNKYEAIVKDRMIKKYDSSSLGGLFNKIPYPHIFKDLKDNFIDKNYPLYKNLKGNLDKSEIKYHFANHLNSSQTMCISYFKKFFEKDEYESVFIEILIHFGIDICKNSKVVDAVFEYIPNSKEYTNFDFYLKFDNNVQVTWEIKFTESEFKSVYNGNKIEKYINKYNEIYVSMFKNSHYATIINKYYDDFSIDNFFKHYQINRNILYAKTKDDYVIFLSPRENYNLDKGRDYIEKFSLKCKTNHIKNIFWEELVDITIQKISKIPELYEYYINFKYKYFED